MDRAKVSGGHNWSKTLIGLCATLLLCGIVGICLGLRQTGQTTVQICQDGGVLYFIDLASAEDQQIEISYENRTNVVEIANGRIRMAAAECPDQLCVQMGELNHAAMPIVCLPNHLTIQFVEPESDMDTVAR